MMNALSRTFRSFAADESGATAIEYGLIISLIFLAILASVDAVASGTTAMFNLLASAMS
jgi:pilus assembly protein Flp/PilA